MVEEAQERKSSILLMSLRQAEHHPLPKKLWFLMRIRNKFLLRDLFKEKISTGLKLFQEQKKLST
jgi:hypothetical protein